MCHLESDSSLPAKAFYSANERCWLVYALLDAEQGFESDFPPRPVIQVFAAITACVCPL